MSDLFISYARKDQAFVRRLHDALAARGKEAWVDWEDIPASAKWLDELRGAIEAGDAFGFVISPDSVASAYCRQEAEHALAAGKRIVPIVWREVDAAQVPEGVSAHNWITMREGDDFEAGVDSLVKALDTDLDWVKAHTRLLTRALEWDRGKRDSSFLLRGRDLEAAEGWLSSGIVERNPRPTPLMTEYVIASRRAATRGQRTRVGVLSTGLVIALALTVFSLIQLNEAVAQRSRAEAQTRVATGRELAQASANQLQIDPELSLLLAIKGVETSGSLETDQAIRAALQASRVRRAFATGRAIRLAALSGDGRRGIVGGPNAPLDVWDTTNGTLVRHLADASDDVAAVAISSDGGRAVAAAQDGGLRLWDLASNGGPTVLATNQPGIASLALDARGTVAIVTGQGGRTEIWDLASLARIRTFDSGADAPITCSAFSADGSRIATGGADGRVRVFDTASGKLLQTLEGQRGGILALTWSADGVLLASGADDGTARVWDMTTGDVLSTTTSTSTGGVGHSGAVTGVAFNADASRLLTSSPDGTAWIWVPGTGVPVLALRRHPGPIAAATFLGGQDDVVSVGADGSVRQWETRDLDVQLLLRGHGDRVVAFAVSPDRATIATGSLDATARIWDATSGKTILRLKGHQGPVLAVAFAPDGRRVATASVDGSARIWDVATGAVTQVLQGSGGIVYKVAFTADGSQLVAATDGGTNIWSTASGQLVATLPGPATAIDASSAGGLLAVGDQDFGIRIVDGETHAVRRVLTGHTEVIDTVRFDPLGERIVSSSGDGTARVWDVATGATLVVLRSSGGQVTEASWSPDGRRIATASFDGKVRVWDASTGELLAVYPLEQFAARAVVFGPNGKSLLASSHFEGRLISCDVCGSADEVLALARSRLTRELTSEEQAQFLHVALSKPQPSAEASAQASATAAPTVAAPSSAEASPASPAPSTAPSLTPSPSASSSGGPMELCVADQRAACDLAPGRYRASSFNVPFTFAVDGSWQNAYSSSALQFLSHRPDDNELSLFTDVTKGTRFGKIVEIAQGAGGFITYLKSLRELALTEPGSVTAGGLSARRFDVSLKIGDGVLDMFFAGEAVASIQPGERERITVVDVRGKTVVILEDVLDGAQFDEIAPALEQVIASIRFE